MQCSILGQLIILVFVEVFLFVKLLLNLMTSSFAFVLNANNLKTISLLAIASFQLMF